MSDEILIYPKGEFSHTEFAQTNGKTNQQVWNKWKELITNGQLIPAGTRKPASGRGKPTNLYKLADGSIVMNVINIQKDHEFQMPDGRTVEVFECEVEKPKQPEPTPEPPMLATAPEPTPAPVVIEKVDLSGAVQMKETCPFCKHPLWSVKDSTGYTVWCAQDRPKTCSCMESPYGHGSSVKGAYEILVEKFGKYAE